jgi:hypothetical protein
MRHYAAFCFVLVFAISAKAQFAEQQLETFAKDMVNIVSRNDTAVLGNRLIGSNQLEEMYRLVFTNPAAVKIRKEMEVLGGVEAIKAEMRKTYLPDLYKVLDTVYNTGIRMGIDWSTVKYLDQFFTIKKEREIALPMLDLEIVCSSSDTTFFSIEVDAAWLGQHWRIGRLHEAVNLHNRQLDAADIRYVEMDSVSKLNDDSVLRAVEQSIAPTEPPPHPEPARRNPQAKPVKKVPARKPE